MLSKDLAGLRYTKGHGTENDFVLYADPEGLRPLTAEIAAWLCDRRAGIGADGVIRAVPADAEAQARGASWFMDYRNADGSLAEMCGNGARVFVEFLQAEGLVSCVEGQPLTIATRGGLREVTPCPGRYSVDMGCAPESPGPPVWVGVPGINGMTLGTTFRLPNPHVVVAVTEQELRRVDLTDPPELNPVLPEGTNVEFIAIRGVEDGVGHLAMRVYERGVGETRSCGTGAAAAALAARAIAGEGSPNHWLVDVPGGRLEVQITPTAQVLLAGPATLVAQGTIL